MSGPTEAHLSAVMHEAARFGGLDPTGARLLGWHSNAVFALPVAGVAVRIATNPHALPNVTAAVAVTRWLAGHGFACTAPADVPGQPLVVQRRTVSFWRLVPVVEVPRPDIADLGELLRRLHRQPAPPVAVPPLTDPLQSLAGAVATSEATVLEPHRRWLARRIAELRDSWRTMRFARETTLVHGDAHGNNLLRTADGAVLLGDWDHVGLGPPEWDLVQPHYTFRRFARPGVDDLDRFAAAYGWEVRGWSGLGTLVAIRELSGLAPFVRSAPYRPRAAAELGHRLALLRDGDTTTGWNSPPRG